MLLREWGSEDGILGAEIYLKLSVVILDALLVYSSVVFFTYSFSARFFYSLFAFHLNSKFLLFESTCTKIRSSLNIRSYEGRLQSHWRSLKSIKQSYWTF